MNAMSVASRCGCMAMTGRRPGAQLTVAAAALEFTSEIYAYPYAKLDIVPGPITRGETGR